MPDDVIHTVPSRHPIRPVRSYVLRQGRLSPAQARALDAGDPWLLSFSETPIDFAAVFGRVAPTVLEIGFGMGHATADIAAQRPDENFLGVEVHLPGVGSLLKMLRARDLHNVRIIRHDAVEVLNAMIADASLAGVHVFFPDPWPKKRHHKRRLIQAPFVSLVARKLVPGGYLHCATDWQDYAAQMLAVLSQEATLLNTVDDYAPRPAYRVTSNFERRGIKLGHGIWDLVFRKRG